MNEEEFEELFGNTPFENIKKIQHYIDKNYIPVQIIEDFIKEYQDLKEIEESHRKENGELREKVKQLEEENKTLNERR